jgi:hypothetical protein
MARIHLTPISEATGELRELYRDIERVRGPGKVSNLFRGYGAWPALARKNWERMQVLLTQGTLSRALKEAIMLATAQRILSVVSRYRPPGRGRR